MVILIFGATGLAGGGVLRACLESSAVTDVRSISRRSTGVRDPRLAEFTHDNYLDYTAVAPAFAGVDACFFCLGLTVRQAPIEADYRRIHQQFPIAAARKLRERSPAASFHYLSGGSSGLNSRWMWARVKAEAERDLMNEFGAACWRPAMIGGTPVVPQAAFLELFRGALAAIFKRFKSLYIEPEDIGRAMLQATRTGLRNRIFENAEMRDLAQSYRA
jgi:uncharacterized protein YbjT (DUF2867 family)